VVAEGIGDTRNGKVCAVEVWVESEWRRLISVYAPADESERRLFVEGLEGDNALLKGAIVQGDMNCVARPSVDEHRINGRVEAAGTGKKLESVLTQAGLIDAHRLVNGEEARDYTRISSTIKRRLDRFYTPAYNAFWRWTSVKTEPNFFRDSSQRSDHLAVMAEVEWAGARPPTRIERRIKVEVLHDEEVRRKVRGLINAAYREFPTEKYGRAVPWTLPRTG
jgi:hypothetical protein